MLWFLMRRGWSLERKMAFVDVVLGLCGFGLGLSTGIVIGYCFFIYFQHSNVKVRAACSTYFFHVFQLQTLSLIVLLQLEKNNFLC